MSVRIVAVGVVAVLVLVSAVAAALVGGGLTAAQEESVYHACVKNSGAMFLVEGPDDCGGNEVHISWNEFGPPGPQGPQGENGPPGLPGTFYQRTSGTVTIPPGGWASAFAPCDAGDHVTGGGFWMPTSGSPPLILESYPVSGASGPGTPVPGTSGWQAGAQNNEPYSRDIVAYAICADMTP